MKESLKWWKKLSFKQKWNLSINNVKHFAELTETEIFNYYKKKSLP